MFLNILKEIVKQIYLQNTLLKSSTWEAIVMTQLVPFYAFENGLIRTNYKTRTK